MKKKKPEHPLRRQQDHWTLDKRVPLGLIFAIALQTCSFIWWASGIDRSVSEHERRIQAVEAATIDMSKDTSEVSERLARLEEKTNSLLISIQGLNNELSYANQLKSLEPCNSQTKSK
jgi:hypothetical protein